jgi:hypothetical protein
VALLRTDVSEERIASIIRVKQIKHAAMKYYVTKEALEWDTRINFEGRGLLERYLAWGSVDMRGENVK